MNRNALGVIAIALLILVAGVLIINYDDDKPSSSVTLTEGMVDRTYTWSYNGQTYSLELSMPLSDYYAARAVDRGTTTLDRYAQYVQSDADVVKVLSGALKTAAGSRDVPSFVLSFVQSIPYQTDKEFIGLEEYPKFPIETLVDYSGDCEDVAGLYVSLMRSLGYNSVMIFIPTGGNTGHMSAGIAGNYPGESITDVDGIAYYYAECTARGWMIGQVPDTIPFGNSGTMILGGAEATVKFETPQQEAVAS